MADCRTARQGALRVLDGDAAYVADWNRAVNNDGLQNIPAASMQAYADQYGFHTVPSSAMQTPIAEFALNAAEDANDQASPPPPRVWTCPPNWIWDATGTGVQDVTDYDPDSGGVEVIAAEVSEFQTVSLYSRGLLDDPTPDPDVGDSDPGSATDALGCPGPGCRPDSDSDSDSRSDTTTTELREEEEEDDVDWAGALEGLRRFRLDGRRPSAPAQPLELLNLTAAACDLVLQCRARRMGFDFSKDEDREAFFNATRGHPKRYAEEAERRSRRQPNGNASLDARDDYGSDLGGGGYQLGNIRMYVVTSRRDDAEWTSEIIESTPYPNGNQGDDLRALNGDPSRYVVKSTGCGPTNYTLKTDAGKNEANGIWVSEHILELNSIGRFMTSLLDGGLDGLSSSAVSNPVSMPAYTYLPNFLPQDVHQVKAFARVFDFPAWRSHSGIKPSDTCLAALGSVYHLEGLVVCDSKLNTMKTQLYKLQNPVGEYKWTTTCILPIPRSLERAMAYIQTMPAVFDYYDDPNVKKRHEFVYQLVMHEMQSFELAYRSQFGRDIRGRWQTWWQLFLRMHFSRIKTWANLWLQRLFQLRGIWLASCAQCNTVEWCGYCVQADHLIESYWQASVHDDKIKVDLSIFGGIRDISAGLV